MKYTLLILAIFGLIVSCEEKSFIPKPPTYLRLELPDHSYKQFDDSCNYSFEIPEIYSVTTSPEENGTTCHKRIDLGPLNATAYIRYWSLGDQPLSFYINGANDEVGRHKLKATNIEDTQIIRNEDRVFGTFFALEGDVATPFQFYLTDSTDNFLYCEVLFNSSPNYDSLKPSLDYLKVDLDKFTQTLTWK